MSPAKRKIFNDTLQILCTKKVKLSKRNVEVDNATQVVRDEVKRLLVDGVVNKASFVSEKGLLSIVPLIVRQLGGEISGNPE